MYRLLDSFHKLADCTMFIIFGVSDSLYTLNSFILLFKFFRINCYVLWNLGYKSLQDRKESRESAWRAPGKFKFSCKSGLQIYKFHSLISLFLIFKKIIAGWDECVAYTVPLIREMHTRILKPTKFSPTQ